MQHGSISLQGASTSQNKDRCDVAVSIHCCSLAYSATSLSKTASCTFCSVMCCIMQAAQLLCTSRLCAAAHVLRQARCCAQSTAQSCCPLRESKPA